MCIHQCVRYTMPQVAQGRRGLLAAVPMVLSRLEKVPLGGAGGAGAGGAGGLWRAAAASPLEVAVGGEGAAAVAGLLLRHVALPLLLGLGLLLLLVRHGKHLVNKPQLCPHLAVTVSREAAVKEHKHKKQH